MESERTEESVGGCADEILGIRARVRMRMRVLSGDKVECECDTAGARVRSSMASHGPRAAPC